MREKLLDLMKSEGLKPSQLAELLGVNPAGISHILAGRNKPGFDLLQKILRRFPQINPDWLLLDSQQMYVRKTEEGRRMQTKDARPTPHPIRNAEPRYRAADYSADYLRDQECRPHGTVPARCLMEEEPTAGEATECPEFRETDRTATPSTLRGRTRSAGYRMAFGPESGSRLRG